MVSSCKQVVVKYFGSEKKNLNLNLVFLQKLVFFFPLFDFSLNPYC